MFEPGSAIGTVIGFGLGGGYLKALDPLGASLRQIGDIKAVAMTLDGQGTLAYPDGHLLCDGSAVLRSGTYGILFAAIGTIYGVGNGTTTFNLPDLQSRFQIGAGSGSGLTQRNIGQGSGAEAYAISAFAIPPLTITVVEPNAGSGHTHAIIEPNAGAGHSHEAAVGDFLVTGAGTSYGGNVSGSSSATTAAATTGVTLSQAETGVTATTPPASTTQPCIPPWSCVAFLIRYA